MLTLNLAYPEKGDIKFKKLSFPDGQQDIVILNSGDVPQRDVRIISRCNSFLDIELICCAVEALNELGKFKSWSLQIPYLLGGRSDRKFIEGGTSYLAHVIAPIINDLDFNLVEILDAHSDVTAGVIENYDHLEAWFPSWAIGNISRDYPETRGNYRIISPDAGALKKIYKIAEEVEYDQDIIVASKHREVKTGKILSTEVPLSSTHHGKHFVIFDDICDGGRTFIEIAKKVKEAFPEALIFLAVSHGIFSQGLEPLREHFTHIYTTNSVQDLGVNPQITDFVTQMDVL